MHELFSLTTSLPVDPGSSPFHVRGTYYTRLLGHAQLLPGRLPTLIAAIPDDRVRTFLRQNFSWNKWYDALPLMPISVALAGLRGESYEQLFHQRGYIAAREEIPRVFRLLLSLSSPRSVGQRMPLIATSVFDFGSIENTRDTDTTFAGVHRGVPLLIAPYVANVVAGFIQGALDQAGAQRAVSRYTDVTLDREVAGYKTVSIRYESTF